MTPEMYQAWLKRQQVRFELWVQEYFQDTVRWEIPGVTCGLYQSYWDLWLYHPLEEKE